MSMLRRRLMNSRKEEELSYTDKYLTIEALEDGVTVFFTNNGLEYCVDGDGNWRPLYEFEDVIIDKGHTLHFRGNLVPDEYYGVGKFRVDNEFNLKGNVMSILYGDDGYLNYSLSGKENAFYELFYLVKGLKSVSPNFLPATTLSAYCYYSMFKGCTNLVKAPELPAEELVTLCYADMFYGCTRLNYIKMLATSDLTANVYTTNCLVDWVGGVSSTGTFVKNKDATWDTTPGALGSSGVPAGWTVITEDEESGNDFGIEFPLYLTFDYCDVSLLYTYCERAADELGVKLYNCVTSIVDEYGEGENNIFIVGEQVLDMLGIEIYVENSMVFTLFKNTGAYFLRINNDEYLDTCVHNNGLMICER